MFIKQRKYTIKLHRFIYIFILSVQMYNALSYTHSYCYKTQKKATQYKIEKRKSKREKEKHSKSGGKITLKQWKMVQQINNSSTEIVPVERPFGNGTKTLSFLSFCSFSSYVSLFFSLSQNKYEQTQTDLTDLTDGQPSPLPQPETSFHNPKNVNQK